eukprot:m.334168 g.334168  ORF g.334168 m.334168 type:complete len:354 (-) comp17303_c0_seq1:75-1136(-)
MGLCMSQEQKAMLERDKAIQREQEAERKLKENTVKLLLLGAGESGKSTLVKQMKIIHGDGYTTEELKSYKPTICDNLVCSMYAVLQAMGRLRINLGDQTNRVHVKAILSATQEMKQELPKSLADSVKSLWTDAGVQEAFSRSNEYQLNDSASYYFGAIDRISTPGYVPSEQDVLRARVKTTGVIETSFKFKNLIFKMIDVGGQRSERRKWIGSFDDVTAVVFVSALSGYDLKCFEDEDMNRVHESMTLFEAICNNKFFVDTAMILFMNKTDLFQQKLPKSPLKKYFPDYTGPNDNPHTAMKWLCEKFVALNKNPSKKIYKHFTNATDTDNIRKVFNTVSDIIIDNFFKDIGLN